MIASMIETVEYTKAVQTTPRINYLDKRKHLITEIKSWQYCITRDTRNDWFEARCNIEENGVRLGDCIMRVTDVKFELNDNLIELRKQKKKTPMGRTCFEKKGNFNLDGSV